MRTSITLPDDLFKKGLELAKARGFGNSFSAYLAWLIKRDSEGGVAREDVSALPAPANPAPSAAPETPKFQVVKILGPEHLADEAERKVAESDPTATP